jgi:diadenylate cyclase
MNEFLEPHTLLTVAVRGIDVLVVAYLIYRVLLVIRGTRAAPMLVGLTIVTAVYFFARSYGLVTLAWLINTFLGSIILVIVVIFQDEIRRALTKVGVQGILFRSAASVGDKAIDDITLCVSRLARAKVGALIVLQREVGLDEFVEDAVPVDAVVSRKLLYSIFVKESPLHDGAVIIDGDRIKAAGCVLPLTFNPDLDPNLGTRHRAAIGLSERSDAVVIVVSEESCSISVARDGTLVRNLDPATLNETILDLLSASPATSKEAA